MKELQVQLDGSKIEKGWFLDFIEIAEVNIVTSTNEGQLNESIQKKWFFLCEQWLVSDKGDGLTSRMLTPSFNDPRDLRSSYLVTIIMY